MSDPTPDLMADPPIPLAWQVCDLCGAVIALPDVHAPLCPGNPPDPPTPTDPTTPDSEV